MISSPKNKDLNFNSFGRINKTISQTVLSMNNETERKYNRVAVEKALNNDNVAELIEISKQFYRSSIVYTRIVEYFANMLAGYWYVSPRTVKEKNEALDCLWPVLDYIELINPELTLNEVAHKVLIEGDAYVAIKENTSSQNSTFGFQYLPQKYCKTLKKYNGRDVVCFNIKFFDDNFKKEQLDYALETFPKFLTDAYKEGKAKKKTGDVWVDLDPNMAFRFSLRSDRVPFFIGVLADILTLQDVKDMSLIKFEQELSKVIIQEFPVDEDGHPVLLREEMGAYHRDLSSMVEEIPGVDVITTFAKIAVEDFKTNDETSSNNPVKRKVEDIYTSAGISQILFNADSAGALAKSVIIDESLMFKLLAQFQAFLQVRIDVNFKKDLYKQYCFKVYMPQITHMNKESMSKLYKEQAAFGFSKIMPAIALGTRQSAILGSGVFEQGIDIDEIIAPQGAKAAANAAETTEQTTSTSETGTVGRPQKSDEERSEKTISNRENI